MKLSNSIGLPGALMLGALMLGAACTPNSGTNAGCKTQGYFPDQSSCTSAIGTACEMTTIQSAADSKTLVCWKPSSLGLSATGTTGTTTGTTAGCSGTYPWSIGPWVPATCDGTVAQQTRTVTCPTACPCNSPSPKPSETSSCTPDLYNGLHYVNQCIALGGSVLPLDTGDKICSLPGSACPAGWHPYGPLGLYYTATQQTSAEEHTNCTGGRSKVYTGFHALAALPIESKEYCSWRNCFKCKAYSTVYATVVRVGCY
jgi:hypothetical protein